MVHAVQPRLDALTAPVEICLGELPSSNSFQHRAAIRPRELRLGGGRSGPGPLAAFHGSDSGNSDTLYIVTTPEVAALYQARRAIQKLVIEPAHGGTAAGWYSPLP